MDALKWLDWLDERRLLPATWVLVVGVVVMSGCGILLGFLLATWGVPGLIRIVLGMLLSMLVGVGVVWVLHRPFRQRER